MYFQMFKPDLEKAEGLEIKLPTSDGSLKKTSEFQKNILLFLTDYTKAFDCGITTNYGKFLKKSEYQTTWEICI